MGMRTLTRGIFWLLCVALLAPAGAWAQANTIKVVFMEYDPKANPYYVNLGIEFEKVNPGTKVEVEIIPWAQGRAWWCGTLAGKHRTSRWSERAGCTSLWI